MNTPKHYARLNPQPKTVIQQWDLNFNLGNVVKYVARAGFKDGSTDLEDLDKAMEYLRDEREWRKANQNPPL